jgi:predicted ATP-dependent serine protease
VFRSLDDTGTRLLRGQLALVCAAPGIGKSAFALTLALKARVPTLYFSADSDAFTCLTRSMSILTGWPLDRSTELVRNEDLDGATPLLEPLPVRLVYDSPSLDQIKLCMEAYEEVMGDFPCLVVVDNITNVLSGGANDDDPFAGLEVTMEYFHDMARKSGACVLGLHHVTGAYNNGDIPIPLSGIKGQIARVPELVLTMHRSDHYGAQQLRVSTVKNRAGVADPSGLGWVGLDFQGETMTIKDRA